MVAPATSSAAHSVAAGASSSTAAAAEPNETRPAAAPGGMPGWVPWVVGGAALLGLGYLGWKLLRPGSSLRMAMEQPHTAGVVLRNPHRPWLANTARAAHMDALLAQEQMFGSMAGHIDDEVDAFRHAYGSSLLDLRLMRDHDLSPDRASKLVAAIGRAHELDGIDNVSSLASTMDEFNNGAGLRLIGDGKVAGGAWIGEEALRERVLAALHAGDLQTIERAADGIERLVATTGATLPR